MQRAIGTALTGLGVTIASTFAPSLGLTLHQQRVGFAFGVALMVAGAVLFSFGWRRKHRGLPAKLRSEIATIQRELVRIENRRVAQGGSIWPIERPYVDLPSEAWSAHKDRLRVTQEDKAKLTKAYRLAGTFNDEMLHGEGIIGSAPEREPDLTGLRAAFDEAAALFDLAPMGTTPTTTLPTRPLTYGDLATVRVPVNDPPGTGSQLGLGRQRLTAAGLLAAVERRARTDIEDELVAMIDEGETLQGDVYGGNQPTWGEYIAWREGIAEFVGSALGPTEKQRLLGVPVEGSDTRDRVGAVMNWLRVRRDQPDSWEPHADGDALATAIKARRLRGDIPESGTSPALATTLDDMIREGIDLRHELEAPVEPEETSPGNWRVDGGVPEGWWEKVDAFDKRIRELLRAERPALLGTYADGHNASSRRLREADENRESPDHKADRRSDAQKMLAFANATREGPMLHMDCILDGLSAARRQFGLEHH